VESFQIRFGKELADLDALEVRFEDADKAYFFRDRLNLGKDSQRYELLDTATGADPSYETLTTHAKRLFRAVHLHERSRQFPSGSGASTSSSSAPPTGRPAVAYRRFTGRPPPPFTGSAPRERLLEAHRDFDVMPVVASSLGAAVEDAGLSAR